MNRLRALCWLALWLAACRGRQSGPPADSSLRPMDVSQASEPGGTCAALAARSRSDSAEVRTIDTVMTPPLGTRVVSVCVVTSHEEHGMRRASEAAGDSAAADRLPSTALVASTGPGWVELPRYMADGPDGSSTAYQRGAVRCAVSQSWDGGDDSDSSYVPADWFDQQTICWLEPGGIAVSDTAP